MVSSEDRPIRGDRIPRASRLLAINRVRSLGACNDWKWPVPAARLVIDSAVGTEPKQAFDFKRVSLLTQDFDIQIEERRAKTHEAFLRKRQYVKIFVSAVLAVFAAIGVIAGIFYYRQASVGQAVLITASLIGIGVVEWFVFTLIRKRENQIPEPLLHALSGILVVVLIGVIVALT
jgi:hypothetical protein